MDPISLAPPPVPVASATPEASAGRAPGSDGTSARPFEEALKQELAKPEATKSQGEKAENSQADSGATVAAKPEAVKPEAGKSATAAQAAGEALPEWAALLENAALAKGIDAAATGSDGKEAADPATLPQTHGAEAAALPTPIPALVAPPAPAQVESAEAEVDPGRLISPARPDVAADPRAAKASRKEESAEALPLALDAGKAEASTLESRLPAFGAERAAAEAPATPTRSTSSVDGLNSAAFGPRWATQGTRLEGAAPGQPATARIDTPIGQHGWGDAFQQKIVWLVDRQQQSAELHVNPPHLGPVDVMLSFADDGAQIAFSSPHAAVREAIEASLGDLRNALSDKGLTLGEALVSADSNQAREQFQAEAQARQGTRANRGSGAGPEVVLAAPRVVPRGLVDLFA